MGRKQPTQEQKDKAAARRERFRELARVVGELTDEQRAALAMKAGIRTIEGHELTPLNQCLLVSQRDRVSVVGGFVQWKKAGRAVRKGESGLSIWVPIAKRGGGKLPDKTTGEGGDSSGRPGFIMGTVFDITQTDPIGAGEVLAAVGNDDPGYLEGGNYGA